MCAMSADAREKYLAYNRAYRQRPDVKAKHAAWNKAYLQRPEVMEKKKIRDKAHSKTPKAIETRRAWRNRSDVKQKDAIRQREYHKRPEAIVRAKERRDRPEAKAKWKAYNDAYKQRPEAKARHADRVRINALAHYGITEAEFNVMFSGQDGRCAICGTAEYNSRGPQIDHDHGSGKVRAILCNACNGGLGLFKDNIAIMEAAISYLRKHQSCKPEVHQESL